MHPFSGELAGGYLWGRGAIDMKNMVAMVLSVIRDWARRGKRPERDLVLAFVADEEAGGVEGSRFLVSRHPDLFTDCSEAIGEVGGFSVTLNDRARLYLIETAEKGISWLRLRARTYPGHGSMLHEDNAVADRWCGVKDRRTSFSIVLTDTVKELLDSVAELSGIGWDGGDPGACLAQLGGFARMVGASLRNTANPTMLAAGYATNVVPSTAEATVDARFLPGQESALLEELDRLAGPGVERDSLIHAIAVETSFDGTLVETMVAALRAEDPFAHAAPLPALRRDGREVVLDPRHPVFRLHAAHAAGGPGLLGAVPRDRRARASRRLAIRGQGPRPGSRLLLGKPVPTTLVTFGNCERKKTNGGDRCTRERAARR